MAYTVIETGAQIRTPIVHALPTASAALERRQAMQHLCGPGGHVIVESSGREVGIAELERLAQTERQGRAY